MLNVLLVLIHIISQMTVISYQNNSLNKINFGVYFVYSLCLNEKIQRERERKKIF